VWWYTPVIPALRKLRQEDCEFEASLDCTVRCVSKKTKTYQTEIEKRKEINSKFCEE
jgi:hypothetical protein